MPNYGDVALGLKADWNRNSYENNSDWMLYTIEHENGKADLRLTDNEEKRHQFRWVDFRDRNEITRAEMQHYQFVREETWTKHPILWEWDGEGYCFFAGQRAMARAEEYFLADQARRDRLNEEVGRDVERETEAVPQGLIGIDEHGKPVRQRKKGI